MFIFKYIKKSDNSLIGYHLSTFCQNGPKERAKRYSCKTPEEVQKQLETIRKNFQYTMSATSETNHFFNDAELKIQANYFPNLKFEDVEIIPEEVEDTNTKVNLVAHTLVDEKGIHSINKPLATAIVEAITKQ